MSLRHARNLQHRPASQQIHAEQRSAMLMRQTIGMSVDKSVDPYRPLPAGRRPTASRWCLRAGGSAVTANKMLEVDSSERYDSICDVGGHWMPVVRFAGSPMLVDLRREVCPSARWEKQGRHWVMSETDARTFIRAAQARLDLQRSHAQISVDGTIWLVGFVRGAPCRLPSAV